jgi:uncharacterized protein with NRDE domain
MCLIFLSLHQHPKYRLVVAANRDEFYARKTAPAAFWQDHPHVLAGRDLEAGGTWMGITRQGRITLITNYRDPQHIDPAAPSRGKLVSDFLTGKEAPDVYLKSIATSGIRYNGFNLIVGDLQSLWYYSNYRDGVDEITPGLHGLSNHLLETPWPKVVRGKEKLAAILQQTIITPEELFNLLYDDTEAADNLLPSTGVSLELERRLSSMFIKSPNYGTRCSTVVLIDHDNNVTFAERVFNTQTFQHTTQQFRFQIQP